jgi:hypothetical protein
MGDGTFSVKICTELRNNLFLDADFAVEIFSKSVVVGRVVCFLGLHLFGAFFQ